MRTMMDLQLVNQRHEERLREAELGRQASALRATRERRAGWGSGLTWEMKRHVGRFLKFLSALRDVS
jgi:hypothetical protein